MSEQPGFDLGELLQQAQQMQQQLAEAQAQAAETVVEGQAGGGMVTVRVNGAFEFQAVEIVPEVIDPDDPEMLQDLVLAALHDAVRQVTDLQSRSMGGLVPGGADLGGAGLGSMDLGGLLGSGGELGLGLGEADEPAGADEPAEADDLEGDDADTDGGAGDGRR